MQASQASRIPDQFRVLVGTEQIFTFFPSLL